MTLQPNTIENQLIEELCRYIRDNRAPSQFEVARLKREAAKLKNGNRDVYAAIMGMIACLENDVAECKKQHELAILYKRFCRKLRSLLYVSL